jgi:2-keto-4-pentenoate hydratase/2-oxohepta-3-ene-1,7-dioic acid hydratase in catechol pathway
VRIARFSRPGVTGQGAVAFAVVEGDDLAVLDTHPFGQLVFTGDRVPLAESRLLAPIIPTKIVAIGKNYADPAREMGDEPPAEPVVFLKPSTSVIGPGDRILRPAGVDRVDFEGELAVVIGRLTKAVPAASALDHVLGYTCANDVTARDQQRTDGQWARAKGYDSFCPLGPWIETDVDPGALQLTTKVNGDVRQHAGTSSMLHGVADLIAYTSAVMTLLPGDVLITGTPAGIGPLDDGDEVSVTIAGIGTLTNTVAS